MGDFETLGCDSFFCTISLVILGVFICLLHLVFGAGMSPSGSLVKTDEKEFEWASALSLSFSRVILLPSPSSAITIGMLVLNKHKTNYNRRLIVILTHVKKHILLQVSACHTP